MKNKLSLLGMASAAAMLLCACGGGSHFSVSKLKGTYTIYANGFDYSNINSVSVAGSITLDGTGNVTAGEQDYFDSGLPTPTVFQIDTITKGTISINSDGTGTLTLQPTTAPLETFSIVQVNTEHLLITEFDNNATSAGSMDLQTSPASVPTGGNAFAMLDTWNAMSFGGVLTSDGSQNITAGEADDDYEGTQDYDFPLAGTNSSFTQPDNFGRGTIDIYDYWYDTNLEFAYYVVGPEAFRLIEVDGDATGSYLAGSMFGQGNAAGGFSNASLGGNFVFTNYGEDNFFFLYGAAGQFTGDGASNATFAGGAIDVNDGYDSPVLAGDITGTPYVVFSNGYGYAEPQNNSAGILTEFGIYMVDPAINIADPNSTTGGGGALMTDLDVDSFGVGFIVPQVTGATFSGNYAFNQDGLYIDSSGGSVFDLIGRVTAKGSNLSGTADFNDLLNTGTNPGLKVTGTFAADPGIPGRSTSQVTVGSATAPNNVTMYQASDNLLLHVDTDLTPTGNFPPDQTVATGVLEKQQ